MSWGYPDGCTQVTHDRAFGESLGEPPTDDVVRLDCGHYDTEEHGEWSGGKLLCPDCFDIALKIARELTGASSEPATPVDSTEEMEMWPCNDCRKPCPKFDELCSKCFDHLLAEEEWERLHPETRCPPRE